MRKLVPLLMLCLISLPALPAQAPAGAVAPRLVLLIVVDQMRHDYLPRYRDEMQAGLRRLVEEGARFGEAHYEAAPTMTAVGHSTILSGATPMLSGIVDNRWYEAAEGRSVESITDDAVEPLGGGSGASPHRLAVTTLGDELKSAGRGGKVYGVSLKDRGAILPAGRGADGAFWFDAASGNFVSSSWYFPALPEWAAAFNGGRPADRFAGEAWAGGMLPAQPGAPLYRALSATPFADDMVLDLALTLLEGEELGSGPGTDLLSVSFSGMDYVGHGNGPDPALMRAMTANVDRNVGRLLEAVEAQAGEDGVLVVFTADHGVAELPEAAQARGLPGGRYDASAQREAVESALREEFGPGDYIVGGSRLGLYLSREPAPGKAVDYAAMERTAAAVLRRQPQVLRVYTRGQLEAAAPAGDLIDRRVRLGFHPSHSPDLIIVHEPGWLGVGRGSNHGSPFSYDTHVPLIFWGPESLLRPGRYPGQVAMQDVAPTLAYLLGVARPSGAMGRVLGEMLP